MQIRLPQIKIFAALFSLAAVLFCAANIYAQITTVEILRETATTAKLGDGEVKIVFSRTAKSAPVYFRPHENERTAADAAKLMLVKYGGSFVELKTRGERYVLLPLAGKLYTFDPNRIFSLAGIAATLKKCPDQNAENTLYAQNGCRLAPSSTELADASQAVADFVKNLLDNFLNDKNLIVAVHNNTDEGDLSIKSYQAGGNLFKSARQVFVNPARDADDFFYVTTEAQFNFFKAKGFNVALQDNANVTDDGSLSVFCGRRNIPYINVESEHGHLERQLEMLEAVRQMKQ